MYRNFPSEKSSFQFLFFYDFRKIVIGTFTELICMQSPVEFIQGESTLISGLQKVIQIKNMIDKVTVQAKQTIIQSLYRLCCIWLCFVVVLFNYERKYKLFLAIDGDLSPISRDQSFDENKEFEFQIALQRQFLQRQQFTIYFNF